jgi:hypothetical protein
MLTAILFWFWRLLSWPQHERPCESGQPAIALRSTGIGLEPNRALKGYVWTATILVCSKERRLRLAAAF